MASLSNKVISIYNRKTSIRLAPAEWKALDTICEREKIKRKSLFEVIDANRDTKLGLTYSVRLFALVYCRTALKQPRKKEPSTDRMSLIYETLKGLA